MSMGGIREHRRTDVEGKGHTKKFLSLSYQITVLALLGYSICNLILLLVVIVFFFFFMYLSLSPFLTYLTSPQDRQLHGPQQ